MDFKNFSGKKQKTLMQIKSMALKIYANKSGNDNFNCLYCRQAKGKRFIPLPSIKKWVLSLGCEWKTVSNLDIVAQHTKFNGCFTGSIHDPVVNAKICGHSSSGTNSYAKVTRIE
jgi:hypothetical protein